MFVVRVIWWCIGLVCMRVCWRWVVFCLKVRLFFLLVWLMVVGWVKVCCLRMNCVGMMWWFCVKVNCFICLRLFIFGCWIIVFFLIVFLWCNWMSVWCCLFYWWNMIVCWSWMFVWCVVWWCCLIFIWILVLGWICRFCRKKLVIFLVFCVSVLIRFCRCWKRLVCWRWIMVVLLLMIWKGCGNFWDEM